jgi:CheY-like chemotaxis protein
MPGMDGFELVERIREAYRGFAESLPIVMLTSSTEPSDVRRAHDLKIRHIVKPMSAEKLESIFNNE